MTKQKGVKEKEPVKIISAKVPESLYVECEELRDLLRMGTMNELVRRALVLFISAHGHATRVAGSTQDETQEVI